MYRGSGPLAELSVTLCGLRTCQSVSDGLTAARAAHCRVPTVWRANSLSLITSKRKCA